MPLYEYECQGCGRRFEVIRKFSDPPLEHCEVCGGQVRKLLSSPAIQFKGSGFYITDYARKSGERAPAGASSTSGSTQSSNGSGSDGASAAPPSPAPRES